jgi:excisionase family DNA binding protein
MHKLITPKELSETLQVGKSTVYQWVHYEFVPYIKIGSIIRFREADIEKWLDHRKRKGRAILKIDM